MILSEHVSGHPLALNAFECRLDLLVVVRGLGIFDQFDYSLFESFRHPRRAAGVELYREGELARKLRQRRVVTIRTLAPFL
jgi:hypothetical protein